MWVPVLSFKWGRGEVIAGPWARAGVAELRFRPCNPIAPRLALVRFPWAVRPPTAPPAPERVPLTAPLVAAPAVLVTPGTTPVAVDPTPPSTPPPPPPERPPPTERRAGPPPVLG